MEWNCASRQLPGSIKERLLVIKMVGDKPPPTHYYCVRENMALCLESSMVYRFT